MIAPAARPKPNPPQPQRASAELGSAAVASVVAASKAVSVFLMILPVFDSVRTPNDGIGPFKPLRMTAAWRLREPFFTLIHIKFWSRAQRSWTIGQRVR